MSPVEELVAPAVATFLADGWTLLAQNGRVNKSWEALMGKAPENTLWCYEWLRAHPMKSFPRRIYPLRGKRYKGSWGFEVTGGDRVYYVPKMEDKTVLIYYAGEHPPRIPYPPEDE